MSGPMLKKCFNCRQRLPDDAVNLSQCKKCQKNEEKYGKPGTCTHCKLNAAFHEQRCVWCSHAERKFGVPFPCANCKLKCAFPRRERDKIEGATLLCRLCILQARHTDQTVVAGIPVPPEKPYKGSSGSSSEHRDRDKDRRDKDRHSHRHHKDSKHGHKRRHEESSSSASNSASKQANNENGGVSNGFPPFGERDHGDNIVKQQKMEDEIRRLKSVIIERETTIFDKDKQISNLKADVYNMEKKHRERVQQLIKEKEESIRAIELMRSSKSSKKN